MADDVFAEAGTTFESWLVLNILATQGSSVAAETLRHDLSFALNVPAGIVSDLLAQVEAVGHIECIANDWAALTPAGTDFHRRLRESIAIASAKALAGIDPGDIETTVNVLQTVKGQAQALRERVAAA
jgi:DNA-binding MarR family transcriptional regulator